MPVVKAESLRGRLARGPLPERETLCILRDVGRVLVYAHERGIVRRVPPVPFHLEMAGQDLRGPLPVTGR